MADGRHIENHKHSISTTIWQILVKFVTVMHIDSPQPDQLLKIWKF